MSNITDSAEHRAEPNDVSTYPDAGPVPTPADATTTPQESEPTALVAEDVSDSPSDSFKLNYLYETAVQVRQLLDRFTPEDEARVQKTLTNPIVRKLLGV